MSIGRLKGFEMILHYRTKSIYPLPLFIAIPPGGSVLSICVGVEAVLYRGTCSKKGTFTEWKEGVERMQVSKLCDTHEIESYADKNDEEEYFASSSEFFNTHSILDGKRVEFENLSLHSKADITVDAAEKKRKFLFLFYILICCLQSNTYTYRLMKKRYIEDG